MVIKKAVIPAAGLGTRFLPATKSMPKEMLPIIDKPVIHYVVDEVVSSGIEDILIITGKGKRAIEDYFDISPELENYLVAHDKLNLLDSIRDISSLADLHYIRQKRPLGLGDAILKAEKHVGDEPFAVLLGDDVIINEIPAIKQLMNFHEKIGNAVIGVEKTSLEEAKKYGVVEARDGLIKNIVEKPKETISNLIVIGRYILVPEIFDCLRQVKPGYGGEIQLTDAINILLETQKVHAKEILGKRYDMGDKLSYIKAIIDFAIQDKSLSKNITDHIRQRAR